MKRLVIYSTLILLNACATAPRPAILADLDAVRAQTGMNELAALVPQAEARAEKLRTDAEAEWPKGHTATAEILAERAMVAYADLRELGRVVRADQRLLTAKTALHQAELELLKLEADQKKAAAEAADYEAQLQVEREAEAIADPKRSTPDREQARFVATKTALTQAKLLCVSANLLSGRSSADAASDATAALAEVEALEAKTSSGKQPAPIREAILARSRCQQKLTEVRRPAQMSSPTSEKPDQLFVELAQAGFAPSRDDRGIVVTLSQAFTGNSLDSKLPPKLAELGRLSQNHGETPVLIVAHSKKGEAKAIDQQRGDVAAAKLREAGVKNLVVQAVGGRLPRASSSDLGAASLNERLEIIFVTVQ